MQLTKRPSIGRRSLAATLGLFLSCFGVELRAQALDGIAARSEVQAGSEMERYLRLLQTVGESPLRPWGIRSLSDGEIASLAPADSAHPWGERFILRDRSPGALQFSWLRPRLTSVYNSDYPYGGNDGAIWAGRGVTAAVQVGLAARLGPLSLVLAPEAFWTQNREFEPFPNGSADPSGFTAWQFPTIIDLPQRFGDEPYMRLDGGQSTLRVDLFGAAAGISTANQVWGPADHHPVLLGTNAPGFAHVFFGTSRPIRTWIGSLHGRVVWGRLEQSAHSPATGAIERRLMSGVIAIYSPRPTPGLEIGLARFFHSAWPEAGLEARDLVRPVEGIFKTALDQRFGSNPSLNTDNQLASVFARWVFPRSGVELYGEFGRDDHPWNLRNFLLVPDDVSGYMLGFQKGWKRSDGRLLALRGEVLNTQVSHLWRVDPQRRQPPMYIHTPLPQGHTHRGQMLASPAGLGGGGSILSADLYHAGGRWSVSAARMLRSSVTTPVVEGRSTLEVQNSLGVESLMFLRRAELTAGLDLVYTVNRNLATDAVGFQAKIDVRVRR